MSFRISPSSIKTGFKVFLLIFIIALLIKVLFNFSITNVIFFFGESLDADAYGHTNVLVLGIGGGEHQGPDLTDTMIIVSLDEKNKSAVMFSVPRDLYVDDGKIWKGKINTVYAAAKAHYKDSTRGLEELRSITEKTLNVPIQYYIKVNFSGFEKAIDSLGGVDIYVDQAISDPFYPNDKTDGYNPFYIEQGWHHMNGSTALKYARSRQTTSVYDRDKRQQKLILALKEKVIKNGEINENKVKDILFSLKNDVETNLTVRQIITLAKIGKDIDQSLIKSYEMHDDPSKCGGWLYPYLAQDGYGGNVLMPAGDKYDKVQNLTNIVINNSLLLNESVKLQILNGTPRAAAAKLKSMLTRYCFNIVKFGNAKSNTVQKTTYYIKNKVDKNFVYMLQKFIPGSILAEVPIEYTIAPYGSDADVIIEVGADYWLRPLEDPYDFIILPPQRAEGAPPKK
ncbi:LCP family protein [Candidatus Peregrinibacteria bacterium]|nr:LCP family protein [Candidatus Peregrinibacteria bacterium]